MNSANNISFRFESLTLLTTSTRGAPDRGTADTGRAYLGDSGAAFLQRHEYLGQISRKPFECVADWCRPLCPWTAAGPDYRQSPRFEPMGTAAIFADAQRPMRLCGFSAFSGDSAAGFPSSSSLSSSMSLSAS